MKVKFTFLAALVLLLADSCRDRDVFREHSEDPQQVFSKRKDLPNKYQRSKEEVLRSVQGMLSIAPESSLRSLSDSNLQFEYLTKGQNSGLRFEEDISLGADLADTLLYVVNLGSKEGFALVSGDRRVPDLLAFVPKGEFHLEQVTPTGSGFDLFLSMLPDFYERSISEFVEDGDIDKGPVPRRDLDLLKKLEDFEGLVMDVEYEPWCTTKMVEPLCTVKWGQADPYNNYANMVDGQRAAAGCVATAFAQLLSVHKKPDRIGDLVLDWNLLTKQDELVDNKVYTAEEWSKVRVMVAALFRSLGDRLGNEWGRETGAYPREIPRILADFGYSNPSEEVDFDASRVRSSIRSGKPVILSGYAHSEKKKTGWWIFSKTYTVYRDGHAWLVDGFVEQEQQYTTYWTRDDVRLVEMDTPGSYERRFLHCNWGWSDAYNGYFLEGIFNANKPLFKTSPDELGDQIWTSSDRDDQRKDFRYNFKCIPYVTP